MGDFEYDLIFEIMACLPLKKAIGFKVLNRTLYSYISSHIQPKYFVEANDKISAVLFSSYSNNKQHMCQLQLDPSYPVKYIDLPFHEHRVWQRKDNCSIIASGGGLVLIYSNHDKSYCVFNPITKEFQLVPSNVAGSSVGLAVDSVTDTSVDLITGHHSCMSRIRLVGLSASNDASKEKIMFKFTTFGIGSTHYWKETDPQEFLFESVRHPEQSRPPVYLNGIMHWLLENFKILAFDLEKCRATIIDGPPTDGCNVWFGGVRGELVLCFWFSADYVSIYSYDHADTKMWQTRHKINEPSIPYDMLDILIFDGERLFTLTRIDGTGVHEIYVHNTLTKEWKNIGRMSQIVDYDDIFIPFVPTLVRLYSGLYLNCEVSQKKLPNDVDDIKIMLDGIRRLFSSPQEK